MFMTSLEQPGETRCTPYLKVKRSNVLYSQEKPVLSRLSSYQRVLSDRTKALKMADTQKRKQRKIKTEPEEGKVSAIAFHSNTRAERGATVDYHDD